MNDTGHFVISLDFELFWGVRDKRTLASYGESIANVQKVIPKLLNFFDLYNAKATFATVGFLFANSKEELLSYCPRQKPNYIDENLSPYADDFNLVKESSKDDPYHYALNLIKLIKTHPQHEISTHTFSHYYCLEKGQTKQDFEADIKAAIAIASKEEIVIESIVFPRNQFNDAYKNILLKYGIKSYRGNEEVWFQSYQNEEDTSLLKKIFRTANCYINLSGHHTYSLPDLATNELPFNIPSSRFLRPFQKRISFLKPLQVRRIKKSMTHAAKKKELFHLWWHPHNFGANMNENFEILEEILKHYKYLNTKYNFKAATMVEIERKLQALKS